MATGKAAQVPDALFARVATINTGSPSLPISWPEGIDVSTDQTFEPPSDGKYLLVQYFPNAPAWEGMASGRMDQGLLQVSVVWPKNQGLIAPMQVAQAVIDHFPLGHTMVSGETQVKVVKQPWAAQPLIDADRVSVPITIEWKA